MLPIADLSAKIADAYNYARKDQVEEFQAMDDEITSFIPHYLQQIKYANEAVINLNKVQLSNILTQGIKIFTMVSVFVLSIVGLSYVPYDFANTVLTSITFGIGLIYLWKKIPQIRQLWKDNTAIGLHGINLNTSLSQSIIALNYIKMYHEDTVPKVKEWERKGLLNKAEESDQSDEKDENMFSLDEVLKKVQNRTSQDSDQYKE